MGKDGFENETQLQEALNNKKFNELNKNLKDIITFTSEKPIADNTLIQTYKVGGTNKTDLVIEFNSEQYNISIKKGSGNSVHQEKVDEFVLYLQKEYKISDELKENILYFIWGDGTLDGTGNVSDRINAPEFKKKYPDKVNTIRTFFHKNKKDLIERFLIKGVKSDSSPDYLYYGTAENGTLVNAKDALDWLSDDENEKIKATIPVGRLTFQAWNRNINGGDKSENKRGSIQIKWDSFKEDSKIISKGNKNDKQRNN